MIDPAARATWYLKAGVVALAAAALTPGFAVAEPVRDEVSGLAVDPPANYRVKAMPPLGSNATRFEVKTPEDGNTGCQIGFAPNAGNQDFSQKQINEAIVSADWQAMAAERIGTSYDVREVDAFDHGEIDGAVLVGDMHPQLGLPPDAEEMRSLFVIMETPKGRTTVVCVDRKKSFEARRAEFEQVAHGVAPPR